VKRHVADSSVDNLPPGLGDRPVRDVNRRKVRSWAAPGQRRGLGAHAAARLENPATCWILRVDVQEVGESAGLVVEPQPLVGFVPVDIPVAHAAKPSTGEGRRSLSAQPLERSTQLQQAPCCSCGVALTKTRQGVLGELERPPSRRSVALSGGGNAGVRMADAHRSAGGRGRKGASTGEPSERLCVCRSAEERGERRDEDTVELIGILEHREVADTSEDDRLGDPVPPEVSTSVGDTSGLVATTGAESSARAAMIGGWRLRA
jgi:hypothetical protein